jgi:hypothetical protein
MHAAALILLTLALGAAPTDARIPGLEACRPAAIQGGALWNCEGFIASVSEVGGEVDASVRAHLIGMRTSLGGEVDVIETQLTLSGKTWPGYAFRVTRPPDTQALFEGTLIAFKVGVAVRLVTCGAVPGSPGGGKCPQIMTVLAERGAPPALKPGPNEKAKFVDRELETPPGCKLTERSDARFQLTCGQTAFLSYIRTNTAEDLQRVSALVRTQLLQGVSGAKQVANKPCRLGGVATACTVLESADTVFFLASAVVKGAPVAVQCAQEKSRKEFHPVCAGVLAAK